MELFGWIVVQVHAKLVAKQLVMISDVVRGPEHDVRPEGAAAKASALLPQVVSGRGGHLVNGEKAQRERIV